MSFRLVSGGWGLELENALRGDRTELRSVSPFIKRPALERLLTLRPQRIRVITRFDLEAFAKGVSDIAALRTLLESEASVRGLRALHAKLYVFGDSVAVVTSANLTVAGLDRNPEFGMVTEDPSARGIWVSLGSLLSARPTTPKHSGRHDRVHRSSHRRIRSQSRVRTCGRRRLCG